MALGPALPIVISPGIVGGSPFALGEVTYITLVTPQTVVGSTVLNIVNGGTGSEAVVVGGADPEPTAAEKLRVTGGMLSEGAGEDSTVIGRAASVTSAGPLGIAIGDAALAQSASIAIGAAAWAPAGTEALVIGNNAGYPGSNGTTGKITVIGMRALARLNSSISAAIAIGADANAVAVVGSGSTQSLIAIGNQSVAVWGQSIAVGHGASAGASINTPSLAIGNGSSSQADSSMAVGHFASARALRSTVYGESSIAYNSGEGGNPSSDLTVIGYNSVIGFQGTSGNFRAFIRGIAIGENITTPSPGGTALAPVTDFIIIGHGFNQGPDPNTAYIGGPTGGGITTMVIGKGVESATPIDAAVAATRAVGSNIGGANIGLTPGKGTGTGAGGNSILRASVPVGAGAGLHTLRDVVIVNYQTVQFDTSILNFVNYTDGAGASVATFNNAPRAGNPGFWLPIQIAGVTRYIPCI